MDLDRELRQVFLEEVAGYLTVLRDPTRILADQADAAHGLKGAAGMLGFDDLHRLAAELETSLRQEDLSLLAAHTARIQTLVDAIGPPPEPAASPCDPPNGSPPETLGESPPSGAPDPHAAREPDGAAESSFAESFDPETAAMLRAYFIEEAAEHLTNMDMALDRLSDAPDDQDALHSLFRASHTLKGAAATVGLGDISSAAHKLEDAFEQMRDRSSPVREPERARLQEATDLLRELVEGPDSQENRSAAERMSALIAPILTPHPAGSTEEPTESFLSLDKAATPPLDETPPPDEGALTDDDWDEETRAILLSTFLEEAQDILIALDPAVEALWRGGPKEADLDELFRLTHTLKGSAAAVGLLTLSRAAHRMEDTFDALRRGEGSASPDLLGALAALHDLVDHLKDLPASEEALSRLEQALAPPTDASPISEPATSPPGSAPPSPPPLAAKPTALAVEQDVVLPEVERRQEPDRRASRRRGGEDQRLIRVNVERFDSLLEAVGQIVFRRTLIERRSAELTDLVRDLARSHQGLRTTIADLRTTRDANPHVQRLGELEVEFADEVSNFERAEAGLREETEGLRRDALFLQSGLTTIRLLSVRYLFARLRRAVRDIARAESKQVIVETAGEETEIDRVVAEKITDPLIQLIRNAVAHGIELPSDRIAAGKPEAGRVSLTATQEGSFVTLEVTDDGRGIDVEAVRNALVDKGLMDPDQATSAPESEVRAAIFLPGLSTRSNVDSVAGRGVGLDVVQDTIVKLGGEVAVASERGGFTRFRIRMPLSTAVTNALLFKCGGEVYCIPVRHVVETRYVKPGEIQDHRGRPSVEVRGKLQPVLYLDAALGVETRRQSTLLPTIVLRHLDMKFTIVVDKLVGPREIVLRSLGPLLSPIDLYSGATISGAGKVQMVLDVGVLHQWASAWRGLAARQIAQSQPILTSPEQDRILVCDDSRSIRQVLGRILAEEGFRVELASDGWDAWERMSSVGVDLLLTDLEMPRMDGYALVKKCRGAPHLANLPILVLSSRTGEENQRHARESGADGFLFKPVNRRVIVARIRELLRIRRAVRGAK